MGTGDGYISEKKQEKIPDLTKMIFQQEDRESYTTHNYHEYINHLGYIECLKLMKAMNRGKNRAG